MQAFCAGVEPAGEGSDAGDFLFQSAQQKILELEAQHHVPVVAFTTGAVASRRTAQRLIRQWRPSVAAMDCTIHMVRAPSLDGTHQLLYLRNVL